MMPLMQVSQTKAECTQVMHATVAVALAAAHSHVMFSDM